MPQSGVAVRLPIAGATLQYDEIKIDLNDTLSTARIKGKLNQITNWNQITPGRTATSIIQIGNIFDGLVVSKRTVGNRYEIIANSGEHLLTDDADNVTFVDATISSVMDFVFSKQSHRMLRRDEYPTGTITMNVINRENFLDVVKRVANYTGNDAWVYRAGRSFWLKIGTRGEGAKNSPVQVFNTRSANTVLIEHEVRAPEFNEINVISTAVNITVPSSTHPFDDASDSQNEFGVLSRRVYTYHSTESSAYEFAKALLARGIETNYARFMYRGIPTCKVGDYVRFISKEAWIDWVIRVKSLEIHITDAGIVSVITVGRSPDTIYEKLDSLFDKIRERV